MILLLELEVIAHHEEKVKVDLLKALPLAAES